MANIDLHSRDNQDNATDRRMGALVDLFSSGAHGIIESLARFNVKALETVTDIAHPSWAARALQMVIICLMILLTGVTVAVTML